MRAIIVDDEKLILDGIVTTLDWKRAGITICGYYSNAVEALENIKRLRPELVITDISMPEYDGIWLLKNTREFDSSIRVILLSGYNDFEYARSGLKNGACDYVSKIDMYEELLPSVSRIMESIREKSPEDLWQSLPKAANAMEGYSSMFFLIAVSEESVDTAGEACCIYDAADSLYVYLFFERYCPSVLKAKAEKAFSSCRKGCCLIGDEIQGTERLRTAAEAVFLSYDKIKFGAAAQTDTAMVYINHIFFELSRIFLLESLETFYKELYNAFKNCLYNPWFDLEELKNGIILMLNIVDSSISSQSESMEQPARTSDALKRANSVYYIFNLLKEQLQCIHDNRNKIRTNNNIHHIMKFINEKSCLNLKLEDIAAYFYMSPSALSSKFKKLTGQNYVNYIKLRRLEQSRYYLLNTDMPIYAIACEVGYSDVKYFSHIFKHHYGVNPSEYRLISSPACSDK